MAVMVDGLQWDARRTARGSGPAGERSEARAARDILVAAGWRVAVVTADTPLSDAWRELHSPATASFLHRPVSTEAPAVPSAALPVTVAPPVIAAPPEGVG
jgi:hypothetical protein